MILICARRVQETSIVTLQTQMKHGLTVHHSLDETAAFYELCGCDFARIACIWPNLANLHYTLGNQRPLPDSTILIPLQTFLYHLLDLKHRRIGNDRASATKQ
jgi:hypothetical protein